MLQTVKVGGRELHDTTDSVGFTNADSATRTKPTQSDVTSIINPTSDPAVSLASSAMHVDLEDRRIDRPTLLDDTYPHAANRPLVQKLFQAIDNKIHRHRRWIKMPTSPRSEHYVEDQFFKIVNEMNDHARQMQLGPERVLTCAEFMDTHATHIATRDRRYLERDVFVHGSDPCAPTLSESSTPPWAQCRAVGEVKIHRRSKDMRRDGRRRRDREDNRLDNGLQRGKAKSRDQLLQEKLLFR